MFLIYTKRDDFILDEKLPDSCWMCTTVWLLVCMMLTFVCRVLFICNEAIFDTVQAMLI